jgi:hypothetical protein
MRHLGAFLLGTGVGSGGVHWNGQIWRFLPSDFKTKSHNQERYGKRSVSDYDLTVQDWGTTYGRGRRLHVLSSPPRRRTLGGWTGPENAIWRYLYAQYHFR